MNTLNKLNFTMESKLLVCSYLDYGAKFDFPQIQFSVFVKEGDFLKSCGPRLDRFIKEVSIDFDLENESDPLFVKIHELEFPDCQRMMLEFKDILIELILEYQLVEAMCDLFSANSSSSYFLMKEVKNIFAGEGGFEISGVAYDCENVRRD